MTQPGDSIRLAELVCARLCHDLGGLIGTVGNAVDMVADDLGGGGEILAFAVTAAKSLTQRLRLLRAAWGPETNAIDLDALRGLTTQALAARRIELNLDALSPDCEFAAPTGRVLLNLILLGCDGMMKGGTIRLIGDADDLLVRLEGPGAAWPARIAVCARDGSEAIAALSGAHSLQMPLTALMALNAGLGLSPVLGPGSGIEALRLETP